MNKKTKNFIKLTNEDIKFIESIKQSEYPKSKQKMLIDLVYANRAFMDNLLKVFDLKPSDNSSSKKDLDCYDTTCEQLDFINMKCQRETVCKYVKRSHS